MGKKPLLSLIDAISTPTARREAVTAICRRPTRLLAVDERENLGSSTGARRRRGDTNFNSVAVVVAMLPTNIAIGVLIHATDDDAFPALQRLMPLLRLKLTPTQLFEASGSVGGATAATVTVRASMQCGAVRAGRACLADTMGAVLILRGALVKVRARGAGAVRLRRHLLRFVVVPRLKALQHLGRFAYCTPVAKVISTDSAVTSSAVAAAAASATVAAATHESAAAATAATAAVAAAAVVDAATGVATTA